MDFKTFILHDLPDYFYDKDTYKHSNGKGLFERYLVLFGEYIDTDIYEPINNYLNIIDASICEGKFLNHLSDVLGNPPDVFKNEQQYRNLLSYIVSVYKIKGTIDAYELFFNILGFDIVLTEEVPNVADSSYDYLNEYDGETQYDIDSCIPCSYYDIRFSYIDNPGELLDLNTLKLLRQAVNFNQPINAKLKALTYILVLTDSMNISINEEDTEPTLIGEVLAIFDTDSEYDEQLETIKASTSIKASTGLPSSTTEI